MIAFFIILTILFFISLTSLMLCLSNLEVEVNNLWIDTENKKHHKIKNYLFCIRLKLFKRITWFKIKIDKNKKETIENLKFFKSKVFNKINEYKHIRDIIIKNKNQIFRKSNIEYIKELNINLKKLSLYMELCTSDSIFTSFGVATLASIISIFIAKNIEKFESEKYRYTIIPKYEEKPRIKIKLNCIISIKIVHIMNVIYMLIKKRSVEYDERTSNRGTYASLND